MSKQHFLLLQMATIAVFAGRSFQHLFWDAPYRVLFWDEKWMSGLVSFFIGVDWQSYVTHPTTDKTISLLVVFSGILYALCALVAIFIKRIPRQWHWILLVGAANLILLSLLYTKDKFYHLGQFFEYSLQFGVPIFLYVVAGWKRDGVEVKPLKEVSPLKRQKRLIFWLKVATALTFTCHGLYAVNYYPRPGNFVDMVINILGVSDTTAFQFLDLVGVLDFIIAIALFVPIRWVVLLAAGYATFWGFGTTIARVWANFYPEFWVESLKMWLHESVFRMPHFLVPLLIFLNYYKK